MQLLSNHALNVRPVELLTKFTCHLLLNTGLKLLMMRYAAGGEDSPASKLINSASCVASAVAEGRKFVIDLLTAEVEVSKH
jgi:hypothetical protein